MSLFLATNQERPSSSSNTTQNVTLELKVQYVVRHVLAFGLFFCWHGILSVILPLLAAQFATLQTRGKLGPVNFRKDFWDCYKGRETLDLAALVTIPETIAGHVSAPVPFPFLNANVAIFFHRPMSSSFLVHLQPSRNGISSHDVTKKPVSDRNRSTL